MNKSVNVDGCADHVKQYQKDTLHTTDDGQLFCRDFAHFSKHWPWFCRIFTM